jgi:hypothetical protein
MAQMRAVVAERADGLDGLVLLIALDTALPWEVPPRAETTRRLSMR